MNDKYIAIINPNARGSDSDICALQEDALRSIEMRLCYSSSHLRLYASSTTPTIAIPGLGVIIGCVFSRNGTPVSDDGQLGGARNGIELEKLLIDSFWGDYIFFSTPECGDSLARVYRDSSGGVPCAFSIRDGSGFMTSSISLAEHLGLLDRSIDWDHIGRFLAFPYLRTGRTGLAGVSELLPGCSLTLRRTSLINHPEWSPWKYLSSRKRYRDPHTASAGVRAAVDMTVKALAENDQEIALEISGGLDSSIVAASLQRTSARVACCTIMPPVPGTDERRYSKQMADQLGVNLETVSIDFKDALIEFPTSRDAVIPSMGILHRAVDEAMARAAGLHRTRSYFSGNGGDSVFCYLKGASPAADAFKSRGPMAGIEAIRNLSTLHRCSYWKAARLTMRKLVRGAASPWKADSSFIREDWVHQDVGDHPWFDMPPDSLPGDAEWIHSLVGTQSYRDSVYKKARHHIRQPLLSQPVVEACLMAPTWMWIKNGADRAVARSAYASRLPLDILHRRSKGSYLNYGGALYSRNKSDILNFLSTGVLASEGVLDVSAIKQFIHSDRSHHGLSFMRLFDLCMVENWVRNQG